LYRRFLSSGFILSTSAAIILPWYTMDLKNLEAFLPGPRQASERGVCPLAGSKWGSAFDTVFSVWRLHVRSKCILWHIIYTCWLQRDTVLLHLLPQTPHDLRAVSLFFSLNQLHESIQSNTSAWQCVAYFPTMIFYIYCISSYMVYYVALGLCGYKCPKVYKYPQTLSFHQWNCSTKIETRVTTTAIRTCRTNRLHPRENEENEKHIVDTLSVSFRPPYIATAWTNPTIQHPVSSNGLRNTLKKGGCNVEFQRWHKNRCTHECFHNCQGTVNRII
jgi:hypothetical protein